MENIIIQAGGMGTRLEKYTRNKPKCLVSVNNLPILFYIFNKYPTANFQIICDYKSDVLEKYMKVFSGNIKYSLIKAKNKGTSAGIKEAINMIPDKVPFMLMWSDLILPDEWEEPLDLNKNYIGLARDFECRWSYVEGKLQRVPSKKNGVAGLFIFKNKHEIIDVNEDGAFVKYLQNKNLELSPVSLLGTREVGTILSYNEYDVRSNKCRPFNRLEFCKDIVVKKGITEHGLVMAKAEVAWYKKVKDLGYRNIPRIYKEDPLEMERISGKNIFEYTDLLFSQKKVILQKIVKALKTLHELSDPIPCNESDVFANYLEKTFDRIKQVRELIPFANDEYIIINEKKCKNIFYVYKEMKEKIANSMPKEFVFIHGDNTFSNMMFDSFHEKIVLIDPRGYFGNSRYYGDEYYDWAKLYYSLVGNYDQFNRKNFTLTINNNTVEISIGSNRWEDMEIEMFKLLPAIDKNKLKFLHALIWISLTTYAWEDYDAICGAFYNGVYYLNEVMEWI